MIIRIDMLFHPTSFLEYPASKIIEQSSGKLDPALSKPPSSFQDHRAIFREA